METYVTQQFGSGTTNVTTRAAGAPWLYLVGGGVGTDAEIDRAKGAIADEVSDYLNGGSRPAWLDDGDWEHERVVYPDGLAITATGPMVDRDPPNCRWIQDESSESHQKRRELIRLLKEGPTQ